MLTSVQLKARKSGLGGSDLAAICGISPWSTPLDVYLDKINPEATEKKATASQTRGSIMEAEIIATYANLTSNSIELEKDLLRHPKYNFAIGSIDAWVNNKEFILECKTANWAKAREWGEEGTDQVPDYYLTQIAWYAFIADKPKVDVALLLGDDQKNQFRIYTYIRNFALEQHLLKIAENFWVNHVLAKVPPKALNLRDTQNLYQSTTDEVKVAEEDITKDIQLLANIKSQINLLKKQSEELQYSIQNFMGDSAALQDQFNNLLATWKLINPKEIFDEAKFKTEHPDLYKQYTALSKPTRRFEIKTKGDANA